MITADHRAVMVSLQDSLIASLTHPLPNFLRKDFLWEIIDVVSEIFLELVKMGSD